jgi:hypothetical protein
MSASVELQDIRLDSEAEQELRESSGTEPVEAEEEGEGKKGGLDPDSFSLIEAAQYGNLDR